MINSGAYFTLNDNQIDLRANSVKEIYAGNFVDFLSSDELNNVLDNWYTILQHDGEVYMDCRLFGKIIATKNNVLLLRRYAEKQSYKLIKYSIIIPSFNHLDDCLRPCIESIKKYTDLANTEIIVVANGCTDETKDYVEGLGKPFKLIWHAEPLGYAKPLNMGIRIAQGEFVIVLNNDIVLLPQNRNDWLRMLEEPFVNSHKAAASAPLKIHDSYANREILLSFCMMMRASALRRVGIFDESYGFGGGEDVDLCARFLDAGYTLHGVPDTTTYENGQSVGRFPIYHKSGASAADMESITDSKCKSQKNAIQNMIKYNKNIKLELYGKIDSYQQGDALIVNDEATKGNVLMDPLNLTFPRASVDEIRIGDTIDNFSDSEFACAVRNWLQTLKSGGRLIVDSTLLGSFIVTKV
jgi:GT2 family glycosyltransferase